MVKSSLRNAAPISRERIPASWRDYENETPRDNGAPASGHGALVTVVLKHAVPGGRRSTGPRFARLRRPENFKFECCRACRLASRRHGQRNQNVNLIADSRSFLHSAA